MRRGFGLAKLFCADIDMRRHFAFTLAEVLITLGIIGVVAAMTMPTLIQKQQEKATVTALKKFNSVLSQAYQLAITEYGPIENWGLLGTRDFDTESATNNDTTKASSDEYLNRFQPYLKIVKRCKVGESNCFAPVVYRQLYGGAYKDMRDNLFNSAIMSDGMAITFEVFNADCSRKIGEGKHLSNVCGSVFVDINGNKNPNQFGYDFFSFYITKYGVIPRGISLQDDSDNYSFKNNCRDAKNQSGYSCSGWVIYNENMDYLHCDDLSWDGKKTCK